MVVICSPSNFQRTITRTKKKQPLLWSGLLLLLCSRRCLVGFQVAKHQTPRRHSWTHPWNELALHTLDDIVGRRCLGMLEVWTHTCHHLLCLLPPGRSCFNPRTITELSSSLGCDIFHFWMVHLTCRSWFCSICSLPTFMYLCNEAIVFYTGEALLALSSTVSSYLRHLCYL